MPERPYIFDLSPDELASQLAVWGMPRFRATQLLEWVYRKGVTDPARMTNLSNADRELLARRMRFERGRVVRHQCATDETQKLLMDWPPETELLPIAQPAHASATSGGASEGASGGGGQTECVMIPSEDRRTACISSQVGCAVGCRFCASGLGGLEGNLTSGQIVEQVWRLNQLPGVGRITNVVFMGMGEPLANFAQVTKAAQTLMADWGMGISGRKITISTVGLPAQIRRLAELDLPITLAISLHAPNDEVRRQLIPWAEYVTIAQLVEAGRYYFEKTGREVTLEYILLDEVNDRPHHAKELARVAKRLRSNVNLIRYNEVRGIPFGRPDTDAVRRFQQVLREAGVNTHIRASRGRDIAAACGQLRHEQHATGT